MEFRASKALDVAGFSLPPLPGRTRHLLRKDDLLVPQMSGLVQDAPPRPGGASGGGHTRPGPAARCAEGPCLSVSFPFATHILEQGEATSSQEQLRDRGQLRLHSSPRHTGKLLGLKLPSMQSTVTGCPPDAAHGGGPFKPRSLLLTSATRSKGGANQQTRKQRLRELPRFAEATQLTSGPAPVCAS